MPYIPAVPQNVEYRAKMTRDNHNFEQLLDSTNTAHFLKINPKTLQSMARSGQVPAIRVGKLGDS
jgi:hypothetical protein